MTRQRAKSAFREWSGPRPTPETVQMPPYGFRVPQKNASVHADPGSSGECRLSWCRSKRISASSEARDRNSPTKAHQSSLQISLIAWQHRPIRLHLSADRVSDRDRLLIASPSS